MEIKIEIISTIFLKKNIRPKSSYNILTYFGKEALRYNEILKFSEKKKKRKRKEKSPFDVITITFFTNVG